MPSLGKSMGSSRRLLSRRWKKYSAGRTFLPGQLVIKKSKGHTYGSPGGGLCDEFGSGSDKATPEGFLERGFEIVRALCAQSKSAGRICGVDEMAAPCGDRRCIR